jgi:IPT/TIG domain
MNAYVIYADEASAGSSALWNMYTVPGVDFMSTDDRVVSLFSGMLERRKLVGIVKLSENVSVILADQAPQLGGFSESPVQTLPPRPAVTSVEPASGPPSGGTQVTIHGQNLLDAGAVFFGTTRAQSFTVNAAGDGIAAVSPAGRDTVHVAVTAPGGTSSLTSGDQFSYVEPAPIAVVAVEPNSGTAVGGETVRLTIRAALGVLPQAILFGSVPAGSIAYIGPIGPDTHQVTAVTPPNRGDVHVTLLTQGGSSSPAPENLFSYVDPPPPEPPKVTAIDAAAGPIIGGDIIRIDGTDLGDATEVKFGGIPAESFNVRLTDKNAVFLEAVSPCTDIGQVPVTVTTRRGTSAATSAAQFRFWEPPVLLSVPFGNQAVGSTSAAKSATVPLQISLTDIPPETVVPPVPLGYAPAAMALQVLLQSKGLGPEFTVGQFVAAFGNVTFKCAVQSVQLARGDKRDFQVEINKSAPSIVTLSARFTPLAKGFRADIARVNVGGVEGSGSGLLGFSVQIAAFLMNQFASTISANLTVLLKGTGT